MVIDANTLIKNEIAVWMEIDGDDALIDISRCRIVYPKNGIPTASDINVMIGSNVTDNTASADGIGDKLKRFQRIKIRFAALSLSEGAPAVSAGPGGATWPDEAYISTFPPKKGEGIEVFKGTLTSASFRCIKNINGTDTSYSVSAIGFLNDLAGGPIGNRAFSEKHPMDPMRQARLTPSSSLGNLGLLASDTPDSLIEQQFNKESAPKDLWKLGLSPMLHILSEQADDPSAKVDYLSVKSTIKNPDWMSNGGQDTVSLDNVGPTGARDALSTAIIRDMSSRLFSRWWGTNVWTVTVDVARKYHLAVIPTITAYAVVPFTPNLSGEAYVTIKADEYDLISQNFPVTVPLRRVSLIPTTFSDFFLSGNKNNVTARKAVGVYPPLTDVNASTVKYETRLVVAPAWLNTVGVAIPYYPKAEISESSPGTTLAPLPSPAVTLTGSGVPIGEAYAKLEYFSQLFENGTTSISGRLRFDIGPGSLLEVESALKPTVSSEFKDESIFGIVESVILDFDIIGAGGGTVKTSFNLSNTRTSSEQADLAKTSETHPLYGTTWKGTPLLENPGEART